MELEKRREILNNINAEVSKVVIGKDDVKEILLVALLSQGHVLIEGLTGTAKTTITRTFAQVIGGKFKRVQGTPDMLPSDILGFHLYRPDGGSTFVPGPILANVVLVDELNRMSARTQAALLEAMQERQVTIERETYALERPFIVLASQIPQGGIGTSPLSDVQIDRFMFRMWSAFPSTQEESQILENIDQISEQHVSSVATLDDIIQLQQEVKEIHIADSIRQYIIDILNSLRHHQDLLSGPSPRGGIALLNGARAFAFMQGRDFVIPDDVKRFLIPALCHRLRISTEAEMENVTAEAIIGKITTETPVLKELVASQTGEASKIKEEDPEVLTSAFDETGGVVDEANEEAVTEVKLLSDRVEETLSEVREALAKVGRPGLNIFSNWELIVIFCAAVAVVVIICVTVVLLSSLGS
jgi:MoxR-like ATPase